MNETTETACGERAPRRALPALKAPGRDQVIPAILLASILALSVLTATGGVPVLSLAAKAPAENPACVN